MIKVRWIWASTATVAALSTLGAGLWLGGGPTIRQGWEAVSWTVGITTTLWLVVTATLWVTSTTRPSSADKPNAPAHTANTVNGNVSDSTVIQGHNVHMDGTSYGGDHIDQRGSEVKGTVIGKQVNHHGNDDRGQESHR